MLGFEEKDEKLMKMLRASKKTKVYGMSSYGTGDPRVHLFYSSLVYETTVLKIIYNQPCWQNGRLHICMHIYAKN